MLVAIDGPMPTDVARRLAGRGIPACVPGCVHQDLLRARLIPDPAHDRNELAVQWIGRTRWRYERRFDSPRPPHVGRVDLVFDRLDTIARVRLNGAHLGDAANAHHPHRFDARGALREGENLLAVDFAAPLDHIRTEERRLGARPVNGDWDPFIFLRKPACNLGWDWGPRLATVGIGPVRIEHWGGARLDAIRPLVQATRDEAVVDVHVDFDWDDAAPAVQVWVELLDPHGALVASARADASRGRAGPLGSLRVPRPRLWWPRGHGDQPLYTLRVRVHSDPPQEALIRIGLRSVALDTGSERDGSRFRLDVNGAPIFCKGANWIPEGLFPGLADAAVIRQRVRQAADAGLNTLRVWGGGLYESDDFFDACDELGVLVWQDFAFACAMYPEEPPYPALVEREARHNIARLARHPSLALWCGGNECVWGHDSWGWKERLGEGQSWGAGYFFDRLPKLVAELDPTRPYWPNSPWSGEPSRPANDPRHGDRHIWDTPLTLATRDVPRFVSEFGHQSPPTRATLAAVVPPEHLRHGSASLAHRQRGTGGDARHIDGPLAEWFRAPEALDDWMYLAHVMQARTLRTHLTWLRVHRERCGGALLWQLNDCWAGMSWSIIDAGGRPKPAWFAVRRALAPRLLALHRVGSRVTLFADNDTDERWHEEVRLRWLDADGRTHRERGVALDLPPRSAGAIADATPSLGAPIVDARCDSARDLMLPDGALPPARVDLSIERSGHSHRVTLTAVSVVRELVLAVDSIDPLATASDQFLTLLPGESCVVEVESARGLAPDDLTSPAVLRTTNTLARRSLLEPLGA
ncbi:MAG: glycoside hydrolase family 2 protein [Phycisphaerae bacterium]|nr:glycoside hydrolase family 2 protein [Phycisphaerae bacterium]